MKYRLITVIWGQAHTDIFLRLTLRSLLAPGNLADAPAGTFSYTIYTTREDADRLQEDALFRRACELADVSIETFSLKEIDAGNSISHWVLWRRGIAQARKNGEVVITVAGDHILSRGTLARWRELFESGSVAIFSPGLQVVRETLKPELDRRFPRGTPIDLPVEDLRALMLAHLHPSNIIMFPDCPATTTHPEYRLMPLPGRGFQQSIRTSHAVAFNPGAVETTDNLCPLEKLNRIAFEPCRFLSAEPFFKAAPHYMMHERLDDVALSRLGSWVDEYMSPVHMIESDVVHSYSLTPTSPAELRVGEQALGFQRQQLLASRTLFRVWRSLRAAGLIETARWLAAGAVYGRLRRQIALRGPLTVFAPVDYSLLRITPEQANNLLNGKARALIKTIKGHIALGKHAFKPGQRLDIFKDGSIALADGRGLDRRADGRIRIVGQPLRVDDILIYPVDRPLTRLSMRALTREDRLAQARRICRRSLLRSKARMKQLVIAGLRECPRAMALAQKMRNRMYAAGNLETDGTPSLTLDALAALRAAVRARAVAQAQRLNRFYATKVLGGSSLAQAVSARFSQCLELPSDDPISALATVLAANPDFSEAWLEIAYQRRDAGDLDGALDALAKAATTKPRLRRSLADPHPHLVAAIEIALIHSDRQEPAQALAALEAAPQTRPYPWRGYFLKGAALSKMGRAQDAIAAFDRCMIADNVMPGLDGVLPHGLH
jgi:hypothetical protein